MLLSTVIPLYNAVNWLEKAVDSVVSQRLEEEGHEVIIVDDGSTDGSAELADALANRLGSVKVIHQPNSGVSAARNRGLEEARGEWVHFMDADDWIIPGLYRRLLEKFIVPALETPDYAGFWSVTLDDKTRATRTETLSLDGEIVFEGDATTYYGSGRYLPFPVMGWYRREFLSAHNLRFDTALAIGEDVAFNFGFARCNPKLLLTSIVGYRYEMRPGSALSRRDPAGMRKAVNGYIATLTQASAWTKSNPALRQGLNNIIGREMVPFTSRILSADYSIAELRELRDRLRQAGLLPVSATELRTSRPINIVLGSPPLARLASTFYRRLFVPYILPRLPRN